MSRLPANLTKAEMLEALREGARQATEALLHCGEGRVTLRAAMLILGEPTRKRALSSLAELGVAVQLQSERKRYVLRSELDAALRRVKSVPAAVLKDARFGDWKKTLPANP